MSTLILDVNVILRPMFHQPDYEIAEKIFKFAVHGDVYLVVPELFWSEVTTALIGICADRKEFENKLELIDDLAREGIIHTSKRSTDVIMTAYDIARLPKLPDAKRIGFLDAQYHALALKREGQFVTADKQYVKALGGRMKDVTLLNELVF